MENWAKEEKGIILGFGKTGNLEKKGIKGKFGILRKQNN